MPSAHRLDVAAISAAHAGPTNGTYSSVCGAIVHIPFSALDERTTFSWPPWPMYHGSIAHVVEMQHAYAASFACTNKVFLIIIAI